MDISKLNVQNIKNLFTVYPVYGVSILVGTLVTGVLGRMIATLPIGIVAAICFFLLTVAGVVVTGAAEKETYYEIADDDERHMDV